MDWVGPVDNRPSTRKLNHFVIFFYKCHVTRNILHMTCDMLHMTCDKGHVTPGGGCTFSPDFSSLTLTVWE